MTPAVQPASTASRERRLRVYGPGALLVLACIGGLIAPFQQWMHFYPPGESPWPMILPDASPLVPIDPFGPLFLIPTFICLIAALTTLLAPSGWRAALRVATCILTAISGVWLFFFSNVLIGGGPVNDSAWPIHVDVGGGLALLSYLAIPILGALWVAIARSATQPDIAQ